MKPKLLDSMNAELQNPQPLVARFATIRYDLDELPDEISATFLGKETTSPLTFSASTRSGKDNDKDDRGAD